MKLPDFGSSQPVTAERTIQLLDAAVNGIASFDIELQIECRYLVVWEKIAATKERAPQSPILEPRALAPGEIPKTQHDLFRQVYQKGKRRIERLDPTDKRIISITVTDGEIARGYVPDKGSALVQPSDSFKLIEGEDYLTFYLRAHNDLDWTSMFRQRNNATLQVGEQLGLDANPQPNTDIPYARWGFRVRLDPAHGLMPTTLERFEVIDGHPFTHRQTRVEEFAKTADGIWVPIRVKTTTFLNRAGPLWAQPAAEITATVNIQKSNWNRNNSDDAFVLPVPAGTHVADLSRNTSYFTGKRDPGTNLKDLAANARNMMPNPTVTIEELHSPLSSWYWGIGAAIFLVLLAFLFLRWRGWGRA
jgi:hypothetical protein